jgi:hypothetical protein
MNGPSHINAEFDHFLFASIGDQENGTPLSVLSMLARSDIDPWQEAARLAQMPKELAARSVASLIERLPNRRRGAPSSKVVAARLVELLPSHVSLISANQGIAQTIRSQALIWLTLGVVLGALVVAGSHAPPSSRNHAATPLTNTAWSSQASLRDSD